MYRESNKCADALAKFACNLDSEYQFFEKAPISIKHLLEADRKRVSLMRAVHV